MNSPFKVAKEPGEIPALFVKAWMQRDAEFLASLFTQDAEFVNVVGLWWHNKDDIRKAHAYGFENIFANSDLKLRKTSLKFLSDEIAVVHARMRLKDQTPLKENEDPSLRQNIFSFVVKKQDDKWLCESAHNTDIIPGAETNLMDDEGNLRSVNYRDRQA